MPPGAKLTPLGAGFRIGPENGAGLTTSAVDPESGVEGEDGVLGVLSELDPTSTDAVETWRDIGGWLPPEGTSEIDAM